MDPVEVESTDHIIYFQFHNRRVVYLCYPYKQVWDLFYDANLKDKYHFEPNCIPQFDKIYIYLNHDTLLFLYHLINSLETSFDRTPTELVYFLNVE